MLLQITAVLVTLAAPLPTATPLVQVDYPTKGGYLHSFAGAGTLNWIVSTKLPLDTRQIFENEFLALGYFGAWASAPGGGYGYASGTGTIEAAREIAMAQCESQNTGCQIVAEILPSDYSPPGPGAITISEAMQRELDTPGRDPFRAMAVSEDGAYGMVWAYANQDQANTDARTSCQESLMQLDLGLRPMPCILLPGI